MKKIAALAQAGAVAACCVGFAFDAQAARPELPVFGMHAYLGGKFLKKDDWSPAEDQFAYGGGFDVQPPGWPIAFTAEYLGSNGSGDLGGGFGNFKGSTTEYRAGLKHFWQTGRVGRAFVGAGATFARGEAEIESLAGSRITGNGIGGWFGGGYLFELGSHFDLGLQASYSYAKIDLGTAPNNVSVNAGGLSLGGVAGLRW